MDMAATEPFAGTVRAARLAAGLTQEALAERAGVSVRNIQGLERGLNRPRPDTARRLVAALGLEGAARAQVLAAATPAPRRARLPTAAADMPGATASPPTNLPLALTSFVGRERDQVALSGLLARTRLLTLTGSGGVGKTRLALAVAGELVGQYPDGVWLVELAALAEDRLVAQTALETLGTREEPGRPLLATVADYLKEKRLLLVLDNCEHLVAACAALADAVLRRCPGVRVLATSREGLEVAGEHRYRVPSLPVPDLAHLPPPERLAEAAAVALFVARARERRPAFALTAQNARAVAEICARLDGIPLAIELAAARVDSLGVEGIAARLDDRFALLTGGPRTALPRQRTLRAALDWSYDLLTASEQLLLDRLTAFGAGGWTLEAAEAICDGDGAEGERPGGSDDLADVARWEVLDLLGSLVNKSLVQAEEADGALRYGLLETVRQYGHERLAAAGGAEAVRDRHLAWYLALAEQASPRLTGPEQVTWLDRLEAEHGNLRAALRWARERGAAEEGLRLAGALGRFWFVRGYLGEGRSWLEGALAADHGGAHAARAGALAEAGALASQQGDFGRAADLFEQGLALYRALGDTSGIARSLHRLGDVAQLQGDYERAIRLHEEALALYRELGDVAGIGLALHELGWAAWMHGEYGPAVSHYEECVACFRAAGNRLGLAYSLTNLAYVLEWRGGYEQATVLRDEALVLWREVGNPDGTAWALANVGWSLLALGEVERAMALLEEGLSLVRQTGQYGTFPFALTYLGWAVHLRGEHDRAAALQERALALFRRVNYRWGVVWSLGGLGYMLQASGHYGRAAASLREALALGWEIGARSWLPEGLEAIAWLAVAEGHTERAARLGGAAEALREELGAALHAVLHAGHERAVQAMRDALGEAAFATAWSEGRALPLEEAVTLALEDTGAVLHEQ